MMQEENFASYFSVPLVAKGQVKGMLDIFNRTLLNPDQEWYNFLETLGGQAAIAIDNTSLLEDLHRSNMELTLAYDTTLEGWSKALDLRDKETEGHTQRVVKIALSIAQVLGIQEEELIHIQRGALLHDIGKMGIPDSILFKPGPLTDKEWEIMRRHPVYAYELLYPITHLRPALDIPYCHHERWDGTGYPRKLRGEEIPLAGRIFTVVDVWDAITSDRPYRIKSELINH
jgi:putative nucleotidyltransferase with HDIG domain